MNYTQAQIDRANAVSLEDFLRTQGETLIKSGREYRWKEHDSLTVRGNKWFRHSQSKGGYPIDFVIEFYGKSFPEAVQLLTGESAEGQSEASTAPPTAFHLPLHNRTADRAIQYLCESRGLNKTLVEAFLLSGDIYEDAKRHNVVFVGRDRSGTPRYAHVRGTADPFRQDIAGSDKSYPFHYEGNGNQLFVFEAPIDLLSFICLYPQDWQTRSYLALGGVSGKALDRFLSGFLTGKYTAIPAFVGIMALVFYLTFGVIGAGLQGLLELGIENLTILVDNALTAWNVNDAVHSLVIDGIFTGVGSVLSFLPIIVTLFFFLSLLEDTGYMARVAFVMDQLLRRVGLSGRSFVPMLIGFGCSVPAIMATRTLSSDRDRKMTILLTPFMSCSAKLPIYALFTTAFFPRQWRAVVMVGLYLTGIVCGILYALVLKLTRYKGEPVPFVMELPNYRFPSARSVGQLIWEKAKDFLQKAFTIIFVATVLIWFLQTFDTRLNVAAPDTSLLALIGSWVAPIFKPLGFGDWRVSTALITGFTAKESVVSTLTVLLGGDTAALSTMFTPFTAVVFLVFTLLYTPCVAAVAAAKRELGSAKAAAGVVVMQCGIAWVVAFVVHCIGTLLGFV